MNRLRQVFICFSALTLVLVTQGYRDGRNGKDERWTAPPAADTLRNPLAPATDDLEAARIIFNQICWSCHGINGHGDGPAALTLTPKPANFASAEVQGQTDGALFWKISVGRGSMVPFSQTLTARQRWQLVCFIRNFKTAGAADN